jgi:DNA-binding XRE family transcriptional regulator
MLGRTGLFVGAFPMDGRDIRRFREIIGLERDVAARLLGVDRRALEAWENGSVELQRTVRLRVALQNMRAKYRQLLDVPEGLDAWHRWLKQTGRASEE